MKHRNLIIGGLVAIGAVALAAWVLNNTYWDEVALPSALRGEAKDDPFYAAKALVRELGGEVSEAKYFTAPSPRDVIFLSNWSWNLGEVRRRQLEQWVESGGRLVMDDTIWLRGEVFTAWSGVNFAAPRAGEQPDTPGLPYEECRLLQRDGQRTLPEEGLRHSYQVCDVDPDQVLTTQRRLPWQLRDDAGIRALRTIVGQGSVTLIVATPFHWRNVLRGDHAELFVAMTQLRRGDRVHFLAEDQHPSMFALTWQLGWPALVPALLALALLLWRTGTRFGPLVPVPAPVRRSLVEQIRGTGKFLVRRGGAAALHAASVRALETAARRSVPQFDDFKGSARIAAMAQAAGISADSLAPSLQVPASPRSLLTALVQLEGTRRRILSPKTRRIHGS